MNGFRALVWKEWRDARWTVLVAGAIAALLTLGWHVLLPASLRGGWTAVFALVVLPALFMTVLAGDLVAGDARGGRLASLRALPVSPIAGFGAKLAFLAWASALFLVWCFALQLPFLTGEPTRAEFLRAAEQATPFTLLAVALGAGALFSSSQAVGGLKAMLLSALIVGAPFAGLVGLAVRENMPLSPAHVGLYVLASSATAVVAAAITYCHGRLHLGARFRPAFIGWSALVLCALPPVGFGAYRVARWRRLEPGSERVALEYLSASPDGRYVGVQVCGYVGGGWPTVRNRVAGQWAVWIVDLERECVEVLPGRSWVSRRWSEAGELLLTRAGSGGFPDLEGTRRLDPETMELRGPLGDPRELYEPWQSFPQWAHVERLGDHFGPRRVHWRGRDSSELFEAGPPGRVVPQHVPGVVLHRTAADGLERVEFGSARSTLVEHRAELEAGFDSLSFDDRYVLAQLDGAGVVLDAHRGGVVAGPWEDTHLQWLHDAPVGRFVLRTEGRIGRWNRRGRACALVDLEDGTEAELGLLKHPVLLVHPSLCRLPDGRLVVLRPDDAVELLAPDGTLERVLVPRAERAS